MSQVAIIDQCLKLCQLPGDLLLLNCSSAIPRWTREGAIHPANFFSWWLFRCLGQGRKKHLKSDWIIQLLFREKKRKSFFCVLLLFLVEHLGLTSILTGPLFVVLWKSGPTLEGFFLVDVNNDQTGKTGCTVETWPSCYQLGKMCDFFNSCKTVVSTL